MFKDFEPDIVMHLAAESHVDQSIVSAKKFIESNINGTFVMLESSRKYFENSNSKKQELFKFQHISTDDDQSLYKLVLKDKTEHTISTKLVVGADGIASNITKKVTIEFFDPTLFFRRV